jgi:hypothetical protein
MIRHASAGARGGFPALPVENGLFFNHRSEIGFVHFCKYK